MMEPNNNQEAGVNHIVGALDGILNGLREIIADDDSEEANEEHDDDDNDDDNDNDDDDDDDSILDPADIQRICNKVILVIQHREALPSRLRDRTIVKFAQQFLDNVGDDLLDMITDTRTDEAGYDGLDSDRDTEDEVVTAIRLICPEVLVVEHGTDFMNPIHYLIGTRSDDRCTIYDTKAVSFVPLFAQLGIEFNLFEEWERGGLLVQLLTGRNVLQSLVETSPSSHDERIHQRFDTIFLNVLDRLRQSGLFKKDDIDQYELVDAVCSCETFPQQRFRYITDWDPLSLLSSNPHHRYSPLHKAAMCTSIFGFRDVFDASIRYFPSYRGFLSLFQMNNVNDTPFQLACTKFTRDKVMEVVEQTLVQHYSSANTIIPFNFGTAFMNAAGDDRIHVDCLYFLSRRQPNAMVNMQERDYPEVPSSMPSSLSSSSSNNGNNNHKNGTLNRHPGHNERNIADQGDAPTMGRDTTTDNNDDTVTLPNNNTNINTPNDVIIRRRSTRKRKRKRY